MSAPSPYPCPSPKQSIKPQLQHFPNPYSLPNIATYPTLNPIQQTPLANHTCNPGLINHRYPITASSHLFPTHPRVRLTPSQTFNFFLIFKFKLKLNSVRERYSRKFQTQFSRQKRKTQKKKSSLSLSVFKYRTTSFLVLLLISLCLLVLFSFCVTTHSRNINKFRISVFFVLFLNCCPYSHGLRFVRWESALCFGLHSRCLSRVSPWICSFSFF